MRRLVPLKHGRSLIAAYSFAPGRSRRWLVFLTESGAEFQPGRRSEIKALLGARLASKFNYLVINKPGLNPEGVDKEAFEASFRRRLRIEDALAAMQTVIPAQSKISLVGYSEGAYLAPELAALDPRVQSIAIIGGGTRGWLKEELSNAKDSRQRQAMRRQVRQILANPRSTDRWNGFSYATWHSYRSDKTLRALRALEMPVLSVLGARDRVIDLKSTLKDLNELRKKCDIRTAVFKDCGHSFVNHWSAVRRELSQFLEEQT